jgi:hypothetical protein
LRRAWCGSATRRRRVDVPLPELPDKHRLRAFCNPADMLDYEPKARSRICCLSMSSRPMRETPLQRVGGVLKRGADGIEPATPEQLAQRCCDVELLLRRSVSRELAKDMPLDVVEAPEVRLDGRARRVSNSIQPPRRL